MSACVGAVISQRGPQALLNAVRAFSLSPTSSCVLAPQRRGEPQSCLLPPGGGSPCDTLPHDGPAARLSRANLCPCPVSADLLCDDPGSSSSQPRALALLLEEQIHSDERARPRPTWTVRSPLSPPLSPPRRTARWLGPGGGLDQKRRQPAARGLLRLPAWGRLRSHLEPWCLSRDPPRRPLRASHAGRPPPPQRISFLRALAAVRSLTLRVRSPTPRSALATWQA